MSGPTSGAVMKREIAERFSREIERYRQSLIQLAGRCDWELFRQKAGSLFDYCETIERRELERRFSRTFTITLSFLVVLIIVIMSRDALAAVLPQNLNQSITWFGIAGSCFEVYFYISFRRFVERKKAFYTKRKERFIRSIERDFKETTPPGNA